ncbi:alpha/beta hydrolase [Aquimarina sp. TRL1]|uniref:alpha/beta fold hydrolase n=1 Tax=Aquimarina sp. (strain TRL1) TaxID=2736252 RepID=UPI0015888B2F|nr:alpha/beta hydrolase [Aquimarina sp. TRL1]QKX06171.1 alpha/beta hydrolase [Aquimarina sp. TRL1]
MKSLYKTEQGKTAILNLYNEKLKELNIEYKYEYLTTSFGETNLIITGETSKPPILLIHGSNGCSPIALETYPNLSKHFRVYAIDVLAQPNKSAENRLSMKDESYGKWMNEIIDKLKIDHVTMAGFSFGGLVILKTLEFNESKIKEVFLSAPAYIVNGNPFKAMFKVFIPMKRYMKTKNIKYVEKFLSELFTQRDEFAIKYLSKVFLEFNMDFTPLPVIRSKKSKNIKTPISIFGAKNDILFPGKKMMKRATKIFPSLKYIKLIEDSKHVQSRKQNEIIERKIIKTCHNNI